MSLVKPKPMTAPVRQMVGRSQARHIAMNCIVSTPIITAEAVSRKLPKRRCFLHIAGKKKPIGISAMTLPKIFSKEISPYTVS